jgi:hypothetical protein
MTPPVELAVKPEPEIETLAPSVRPELGVTCREPAPDASPEKIKRPRPENNKAVALLRR